MPDAGHKMCAVRLFQGSIRVEGFALTAGKRARLRPSLFKAPGLSVSLLWLHPFLFRPWVAYAQSFGNIVTADIENFGKVNDNYYRGSQPDAAQFAELKKLGIKTIVDLRKDSVAESADWARSAGLNYVNIPLTTKQAATPAQIEYFLKLVNDQANWPVFVHCKGGRHRTGEMTAIYRITKDGWTAHFPRRASASPSQPRRRSLSGMFDR